jgi:hypothetical protein
MCVSHQGCLMVTHAFYFYIIGQMNSNQNVINRKNKNVLQLFDRIQHLVNLICQNYTAQRI